LGAARSAPSSSDGPAPGVGDQAVEGAAAREGTEDALTDMDRTTRRGSARRSVIALAALALVAASCGQYGNVHRAAVLSGEVTSLNSASGTGTSGTQSAGGARSFSSVLGSGGSTVAGALGTSATGTTPSGSSVTP